MLGGSRFNPVSTYQALYFLLSFLAFLSACFSFKDLAGSFFVAFCTVFSFDIKLKIWAKGSSFWYSILKKKGNLGDFLPQRHEDTKE